MKYTLWKNSDFDKDIKEEDLGFTDNVSDKHVSIQCALAHPELDDIGEVFKEREIAKAVVLECAKDLRKAIVKLLKFEMTEKDIESAMGSFRWTSVPKDSKKKVKNALSRAKCEKFMMYDDTLIDKSLNPMNKIGSGFLKLYQRKVCLNLIKELKLDQYRAKDANKQEIKEPTMDNILNDDVWRAYVNSLRVTSEQFKGAITLGSTLKDSFIKPIKEGVTVMNLKKAYDEMRSWSDGNKGQILIGTGNGTYYVDDKATMQPVKTFASYVLEVGNEDADNNVANFLRKVKGVLNNI
jgi:hypothetical protein